MSTMEGSLGSSTWIFAAVTLISTFASTALLNLATRYFGNLKVYLLHASQADEEVVTGGGKKTRKNKERDGPPFPSLAAVKLSRAAAYEIKHFSTFDQSVTLVFGIAANCVATIALGSLVSRNTMLPGMCAVSFLLCVYNTLNTVFLDQTTSKYEKYGLIFLFFVGVAGTYALLFFRAEWVFPEGGEAIPRSVAATLRAFDEVLKKKKVFEGVDVTGVHIPRHLTLTAVSVLAGYVSACVFSSALRITQGYMSVTNAGNQFQWGAKYLRRPLWVQTYWHVTMVCPLVLSLFGPAGYPGLVFLVILCHLGIIRSMLQAFLDKGLIEWYETKHSTENAATLGALSKYLKSALQRRLYVLGKVSVQGVTLPLLLMSLAPLNLGQSLGQWAMVSPSHQSGRGVPRRGGEDQDPLIWQVVASYLLWWATCNWSVIFVLSLYLKRAGVFR